ncbi:TPA: hypothetical protein ACPX9Q_001188 [Streptococcus pneumoniae]|nr:Uncharacterised protein [Streptococcus pneumoniae]
MPIVNQNFELLGFISCRLVSFSFIAQVKEMGISIDYLGIHLEDVVEFYDKLGFIDPRDIVIYNGRPVTIYFSIEKLRNGENYSSHTVI